MKITFLALIIYIFFPILSLSANNVELTKNHKKAIAWECNNDLKKKFDSIDDCKSSLFFSLRMDGVLFNLDDFKNKKIKKAEKSCSKRVKVGVYEYNQCLADYLDVNIKIEEPPIVIAEIEEEEINNPPDETKNNIKDDEGETNSENDEIIINQPERETDKEIILTANEIYESVVDSSFHVKAVQRDGYYWCGSSVVIDNNKLATNCHVVLNKNTNLPHYKIKLINLKADAKNGKNWKTGKVIAKDVKNDICIVESFQIDALPVKVKPHNEVKMLEEVFAIGAPECKRGVMTRGEIQNKYDIGWDFGVGFNYDVPLLQTNAHIRGGNSGGGLFDSNANLVGITTMGDRETTHSENPFNIAVSAENFIDILNK